MPSEQLWKIGEKLHELLKKELKGSNVEVDFWGNRKMALSDMDIPVMFARNSVLSTAEIWFWDDSISVIRKVAEVTVDEDDNSTRHKMVDKTKKFSYADPNLIKTMADYLRDNLTGMIDFQLVDD